VTVVKKGGGKEKGKALVAVSSIFPLCLQPHDFRRRKKRKKEESELSLSTQTTYYLLKYIIRSLKEVEGKKEERGRGRHRGTCWKPPTGACSFSSSRCPGKKRGGKREKRKREKGRHWIETRSIPSSPLSTILARREKRGKIDGMLPASCGLGILPNAGTMMQKKGGKGEVRSAHILTAQ